MKLRRHIQVLSAASRGVAYKLWVAWILRQHGIPNLICLRDIIRDGLSMLTRLFSSKRTAFGAWKQRIQACRKCPLFDPKLGTCGNNSRKLMHWDDKEGNPCIAYNGCSCVVGIKASSPNQRCFLESVGLESQWPTVYNVRLDSTRNTRQPAPR